MIPATVLQHLERLDRRHIRDAAPEDAIPSAFESERLLNLVALPRRAQVKLVRLLVHSKMFAQI